MKNILHELTTNKTLQKKKRLVNFKAQQKLSKIKHIEKIEF